MLVAGSLLACATPRENPWDAVEIPKEPITTPLECPEWPLPVDFDEVRSTFDLEGMRLLDAYKTCSETNYDIAMFHVEQLEDMRDASQNLLEAGQHQRALTELTQEILEEERRHWFFERMAYWAGFIIIGAVSL